MEFVGNHVGTPLVLCWKMKAFRDAHPRGRFFCGGGFWSKLRFRQMVPSSSSSEDVGIRRKDERNKFERVEVVIYLYLFDWHYPIFFLP